jgi:DNA-binding NtrC family response regulator
MARLLIVDDEATLLDLLKRYLGRLGYEVETASDPKAALAKFEASPQAYDLVLTDLTFAGLNGEEMIERMRALNSGLRAIITSGYPHRPRLEGVEFLQKPFLPQMLAEVVERALK